MEFFLDGGDHMYAATEHQICSFTALLVVGAEKLLNAQTGSSHPSSNRGHPLSRPKLKSMLALRSVDKEIDRTLVRRARLSSAPPPLVRAARADILPFHVVDRIWEESDGQEDA